MTATDMAVMPKIPKDDKLNFRAAAGSHLTDEQAKELGSALLEIARDKGQLTPQDVRAASLDPDNPISQYFPESTSEAAEKYFLIKARQIISWVQIDIVVIDQKRRVRAFHNVRIINAKTSEPVRSYETIGRIQSIADYRKQVIRDAKQHLAGWYKRFAIYEFLFEGKTNALYQQIRDFIEDFEDDGKPLPVKKKSKKPVKKPK